MLFLLVMRMLVVLVVLMVLEELVVFVGGIFENVISPFFFVKQIIESTKKIPKTKYKIYHYFRVLHSSIPLRKLTLCLI